MSALKPRHELKYLISAQDAIVLKGRLSGFLDEDAHGENGRGYLVNSLYFDTPFIDFAQEKEAGVFQRVKYRIRTYGEKSAYFRLERKAKQGNLCFKTSCSIDKSFILASDPNVSGNEDDLYNGFMARRRTGLLKPTVIVRYRRRAYCREPGRIRITFDEDLCAIPAAAGLSSSVSYCVPLLQDRAAILEIKFDDFLPDSIKSLLGLSARPPLSISKYLLCLKAVQF